MPDLPPLPPIASAAADRGPPGAQRRRPRRGIALRVGGPSRRHGARLPAAARGRRQRRRHGRAGGSPPREVPAPGSAAARFAARRRRRPAHGPGSREAAAVFLHLVRPALPPGRPAAAVADDRPGPLRQRLPGGAARPGGVARGGAGRAACSAGVVFSAAPPPLPGWLGRQGPRRPPAGPRPLRRAQPRRAVSLSAHAPRHLPRASRSSRTARSSTSRSWPRPTSSAASWRRTCRWATPAGRSRRKPATAPATTFGRTAGDCSTAPTSARRSCRQSRRRRHESAVHGPGQRQRRQRELRGGRRLRRADRRRPRPAPAGPAPDGGRRLLVGGPRGAAHARPLRPLEGPHAGPPAAPEHSALLPCGYAFGVASLFARL